MTVRQFAAFLVTALGPLPITEFEVCQTKTKDGDTFHAKSAINAPGCDAAFWSTATGPQAAVQLVVNGTMLFDGHADHVDVDWDDTCISFSGRDKGAAMIDKTTSEKHLNKTPAQIVQTYAARHGLQAVVSDAAGKAGKAFKDDWDSISHRGSEWSHIQALADHFGMAAYMTGGKIYFEDIDTQMPSYPVFYTRPTPQSHATGNVTGLKTSRNMVLGRPVMTNVRSHNHKQKKLISASESKAGSGDALVYNYVHAGLKQDQCERIAKKKHKENCSHEFSCCVEIPGDATVGVRLSLVLSGTGTAWDQAYEVDDLSHHGSFSEGYRMTISGKIGGTGK